MARRERLPYCHAFASQPFFIVVALQLHIVGNICYDFVDLIERIHFAIERGKFQNPFVKNNNQTQD
jgi:hypothetical protein